MPVNPIDITACCLSKWSALGKNLPALSTSSKLVYMCLLAKCIEAKGSHVQGDVKTLSAQVGVSDKTFVRDVAQLRTMGLLKRHVYKTSLGARSYKYIPTTLDNQTSEVLSPLTLSQITAVISNLLPMKLTPAQRILLITVNAISDGMDIVTSDSLSRISSLSGIPRRNILSNLKRLEEKSALTSKKGLTGENIAWCFQPRLLPASPYKATKYAVQLSPIQNEFAQLVNFYTNKTLAGLPLNTAPQCIKDRITSLLASETFPSAIRVTTLRAIIQAKTEIVASYILNTQNFYLGRNSDIEPLLSSDDITSYVSRRFADMAIPDQQKRQLASLVVPMALAIALGQKLIFRRMKLSTNSGHPYFSPSKNKLEIYWLSQSRLPTIELAPPNEVFSLPQREGYKLTSD